MTESLNILIADDNGELCWTIEQNVMNTIEKFGIDKDNVKIHRAFTEHAFDHGCAAVKNGFIPDICIFDLVFNGTTGIDLYKFIIDFNNSTRPQLCIYTGVEKTFEKREEAEVLASESQGDVTVVAKPNILGVLAWLEEILEHKFLLKRTFDKDDPFDLL